MITKTTFGRSVLTSIFSTAVDFGTLMGLYALGVDYKLATALGTITGFLTNFTINRYWAFDACEGVLHWQFVRVLPVQAGSTLWQTLGVWGAVAGVGLQLWLAKLVVAALVYLGWNYPMNRYFVFGGKPANPVLSE